MVDFHALRYIMLSISLYSMSPAILPIILHHFVVVENQMVPGHLGGGALAVEGGKILWSVGDCTIFGFDGSFAPQRDDQTCGKILLIDSTEVGSFEIAAKGVRKSQQMSVKEDTTLVFMDIGGVTAEEVNAVSMEKILNTSTIENFGWGRNQLDGKTKEGTFYIAPGKQLHCIM